MEERYLGAEGLNESSALFCYIKAVKLFVITYKHVQDSISNICDGEVVDEQKVLKLTNALDVLKTDMFMYMDMLFKDEPEKISHDLGFLANLKFAAGCRIRDGVLEGDDFSIARNLANKWITEFPKKTTPFQFETAVFIQHLIEKKEKEAAV